MGMQEHFQVGDLVEVVHECSLKGRRGRIGSFDDCGDAFIPELNGFPWTKPTSLKLIERAGRPTAEYLEREPELAKWCGASTPHGFELGQCSSTTGHPGQCVATAVCGVSAGTVKEWGPESERWWGRNPDPNAGNADATTDAVGVVAINPVTSPSADPFRARYETLLAKHANLEVDFVQRGDEIERLKRANDQQAAAIRKLEAELRVARGRR